MRTLSRRQALLALGALASLGTACGGSDGPSGATAGIDGTYQLRTVNSRAVPTTLIESTEGSSYYKLEVLSGRVVLAPGARFELRSTIRETSNTTVSPPDERVSSGTYTQSGSELSLSDTANELSYRMTVQADGSLVQTGTMYLVPANARYVKQ